MFDLFALLFIIILLVVAISRWNIHPFIALLLAGIALGPATGMPFQETVTHLLDGFGSILKWIGIVMVLGTVIGEILNQTGASTRIANCILKVVGEKRLPLAMGLTGYVISIPVFIDVAYIMLQSITEALAVKSKRPILVVGLCLVAGLTTSHALIPPTPGPLAVAGILKADLGKVILVNSFVGLFTLSGGLLWAVVYCQRFRIPYDDDLAQKLGQQTPDIPQKNSLLLTSFSFAPILLPLLFIAGASFISKESGHWYKKTIQFAGSPVIALLIGMFVASLMLKRGSRLKKSRQILDQSIEKSAIVIMVTGAGGAFGGVIKATGMGPQIADMVIRLGIPGLLFPFLLAAALTTATGSLTVSMTVSASIVLSMMPQLGLSPELAVALICCGAFCVFHVNSSFFWLLNRLHHIPPTTLYRTYTLQSLCMGLSGLAGVFLLHFLGLV